MSGPEDWDNLDARSGAPIRVPIPGWVQIILVLTVVVLMACSLVLTFSCKWSIPGPVPTPTPTVEPTPVPTPEPCYAPVPGPAGDYVPAVWQPSELLPTVLEARRIVTRETGQSCWLGTETVGIEHVARVLRSQGFCAVAHEDRVLVQRTNMLYEEHHVIAYTNGCWSGNPYKGVLAFIGAAK
jgi:hypothetical protein